MSEIGVPAEKESKRVVIQGPRLLLLLAGVGLIVFLILSIGFKKFGERNVARSQRIAASRLELVEFGRSLAQGCERDKAFPVNIAPPSDVFRVVRDNERKVTLYRMVRDVTPPAEIKSVVLCEEGGRGLFAIE